MTLGLAAALVLALSGAAYAADFGGIQRTVQIWFHGEQTDAVMTIRSDEYTVDFTDKDGNAHQRVGGGVAFHKDGTERPHASALLTPQKAPAPFNEPLPVKRTVKKYKISQPAACRLLAAFYAVRHNWYFSIGVSTPRFR